MEDFEKPMYTDEQGVEFLMRKSTRSVYTYHPKTEELLFLCTEQAWPVVAERFGLTVRKKQKRKRTKT